MPCLGLIETRRDRSEETDLTAMTLNEGDTNMVLWDVSPNKKKYQDAPKVQMPWHCAPSAHEQSEASSRGTSSYGEDSLYAIELEEVYTEWSPSRIW